MVPRESLSDYVARKGFLDRRLAAAQGRRQGRVGPCQCECNSGGFCGGCGHAGCGGRR